MKAFIGSEVDVSHEYLVSRCEESKYQGVNEL